MDNEGLDEVAFDAWLADDPRHRSAFDTMWRRIMGSDMDAALGTYERRGKSRRTMLAGGATLLLALTLAYKAIPLIELGLAEPREYAAADGRVRKVGLADGTQLILAAGADVKVRYTRHDRVVDLRQGTVFAYVVHDAGRPFRIDTGEARIVDVGTSFEVSSKPANVRVTVASGMVRFGKNGWFSKPINLAARQAAVLDPSGLKRLADVTPVNVARWRGEWAEYKGVPLRQVIAELQSLAPLPIEIADESLAGKPVSGRIKLTDPMGQLQNLAILYDFQVRQTGDALVITKN